MIVAKKKTDEILLLMHHGKYIEREMVQFYIGDISYADVVINRLKKRDVIKSLIKNRKAYYYLTPKGYEYLTKNYGITQEDGMLYDNSLSIIKQNNYNMIPRVAKSARSILMCDRCGIENLELQNFKNFPHSDDEPIYLDAFHLKKEQDIGKEVSGGKLSGAILNTNNSYRVYCEDSLFMIDNATEENISKRINARSGQTAPAKDIIISKKINCIEEFIKPWHPLVSKKGNTLYKIGNGDRDKYFISLDEAGALALKILAFNYEPVINSRLENILKTEISSELFNKTDENILLINQTVLNIGILKTLKTEIENNTTKKYMIICLEPYKQYLIDLFEEKIIIQSIGLDTIEKWMEEGRA